MNSPSLPVFPSPKYTSLLPSRWGWFVGLNCDPFQTGSVLFQGEWAPNETSLLLSLIKPGQTVLDVGANVGTMTLAFAAAVGPEGIVLAFEPQKYPYMCLCANVALNSLIAYVQPIQFAVGAEIGSIAVPVLDPIAGKITNYGGVCLKYPDKHTCQTETIQVVTIDSLNLQSCHLIKADVEGMETEVLHGARQTIIRYRPAIWAEQLEGEPGSREGLIEVFKEHDYRAWRIITELYSENNSRLQAFNPFQHEDGTPMNDQNVLGLPREVEPPKWVEQSEVFVL